jgi:hypothetical protein
MRENIYVLIYNCYQCCLSDFKIQAFVCVWTCALFVSMAQCLLLRLWYEIIACLFQRYISVVYFATNIIRIWFLYNFVFSRTMLLVRKDMNVNEHERKSFLHLTIK